MRRGLHRPAAKAALRRPAAAVPPVGRSVQDRWTEGLEVGSEEFTPGLIGRGDWIKSLQAFYFEKECEFAGRVERIILEGSEVEAQLLLSGTSSEELLKFATGLHPPVVRVHLCGLSCDQKRSNQDLLHLKKFRRLTDAEPKTWEENLKATDENATLRQRQEEWERARHMREEDLEESSASREKKKKKKASKSKKKEKKEKKQKIGGKSVARKELPALYAGTGLDPDPRVRRRLKKRVRKKLKKVKESSTSESGSSSTSVSEEAEQELLEDRSKVQKLAEMAPGLLAAASVQSMKTYVLQASGTSWSLDPDSLPPIMSQYTRQFLAGKASGGLLREAVTLAHLCDLLLQARPAEALDAAAQRLKSLELIMAGQPWTTAQKVEVVPALEATMASRAEVQLAQKEAQLDSRARGSASAWDKGKTKGKGKDTPKGKEKGKGQAKGRDEGKKTS